MGVYWRSEAEVVSQEPEIVKALIEEISKEEFASEGRLAKAERARTLEILKSLDTETAKALIENISNEECEDDGSLSKPTSVYDLEIHGDSVFFNSGGYGCYGTSFEDESSPQLFEKLFERYQGALLAFEHVHPCQSQGYHFNSQWAKPVGDVDWEDQTTYWIHRRMVTQETELDEGEFDTADSWCMTLDNLESRQKEMPMLYALVQKAKAEGFDDWGNGAIGSIPNLENFISYDIVSHLIHNYWDDEEGYWGEIFDEVENDMAEWVKIFLEDFDGGDVEFEMPDDFPY